MEDQNPSRRIDLFRNVRRFAVPLGIVVAIILLGSAFEVGRISVYRAHPEFADADQAAALLKKVGQLIELPANETPTLATINDAASAKQDQPFLAAAENGDVLIVYTNAAEALLYRPSTDKLIAVGPINTSPADVSHAEASVKTQNATSTDADDTTSK